MRERLSRREIVILPGVYDALTAHLVQAAGFEGAYLSGAGVSFSHLGQPDIGLVTLTEMTARVSAIAAAVSIPLLCDGDNGHGNAINTMRAVRLFEAAGARGIQLEDQTSPKRCGHLEGKTLVGAAEMVGKIRAACAARRTREFLIIGRTDARSVLGLDEAISRARAYREAGADVLFVEAPQSEDELRAIARSLPGVPLVANIVEGGRTPMLPAAELQEMGYRIVLYPNSLARRFVHAARELLGVLRAEGTTSSQRDRMVSFQEINELVGLPAIQKLEAEYLA
jgi:2-methylisocitrate lyase-like PEP mutase family enzyme